MQNGDTRGIHQSGNWFKNPYRTSVNLKVKYLIAQVQSCLRKDTLFKIVY